MTNPEIAQLLRNVAAAFTIQDERKYHFQIVAYQRAADTIATTTTQVVYLLSLSNVIPSRINMRQTGST